MRPVDIPSSNDLVVASTRDRGEATVGLGSRLFALTYDWLMASSQRAGLGQIRSGLLAEATGVSDQPLAAREISRVLKSGGRLLLIEPVRSGDENLARRQDRLNWLIRIIAGCECNRPTLQALQRGGFAIDHLVNGHYRSHTPGCGPSSVLPPTRSTHTSSSPDLDPLPIGGTT
jgi:hypothetical protein